MTVHRREDILARVMEILEEVATADTSIENVYRNRGAIENDKLPALMLLDGDETTRNTGEGRGRARMSSMLTVLHPQVFILIRNKKPKNEDVGQLLNTYRGNIVKAIAADAQLLALVYPHGDIIYDGLETDLKNGMAMMGEMQLNFSISAVMNPNA